MSRGEALNCRKCGRVHLRIVRLKQRTPRNVVAKWKCRFCETFNAIEFVPLMEAGKASVEDMNGYLEELGRAVANGRG